MKHQSIKSLNYIDYNIKYIPLYILKVFLQDVNRKIGFFKKNIKTVKKVRLLCSIYIKYNIKKLNFLYYESIKIFV